MVKGIGSISTGSRIAGTPPMANAGSPVQASGYGGLFSGRATPTSPPRFLHRIFTRECAKLQAATGNPPAAVPVETAATTALTTGGVLAAGLADSKKTLLPLALAASFPLLEGCATLEKQADVCFDPATTESALLAFAMWTGFALTVCSIVIALAIGDRIRFGRWK